MQNQPYYPQGISRLDQDNQTIPISRGGILHTDIWWSKLPNFESVNASLEKEIREHNKEQPVSDSQANEGCWRGSKEYTHWATLRDFAIENIKTIHRHYIMAGAPCTALEQFGPERFEHNHWANINEPGSTNAMHTHSKWHWSGVYYIQSKDTGKIVFYSAAYMNQQVQYGLPFGQSFSMEPSDGIMLLFPSYLMHEVLTNNSEQERINIAFNFRIKF